MTELCADGKSVSLISNDVTSGANPWGCTDYMNEKEKILATGVRMYEYMGAHSMHTKTIVIDDRLSVVGSFNFDMRSAYLDTEMMLVIDSKELNDILREEADVDMAHSKTIAAGEEYTYGDEYEAREFTGVKKVVYTILRLLTRPIRHLL